MIKQYRKKPVVISALQFDGTNYDDVYNFSGATAQQCDQPIIKTLEGPLTVSENDYIIKGVKGEFYPCKPDIFLATYEEV